MDSEQKKQLTGQYTICGVPCSVAGWANERADITPHSGRSFSTSWDTVQRVADGDKNFSATDVRWSSNWWLGFNVDEPVELTAIVPPIYR